MSKTFLGGGRGRSLFTAIKYLTYALLFVNIFLFLQEELLALEHTYTDGISLALFGQVFSSSIDTAAWVILLLLFELETFVLDDEQIRGWVKRCLHWVRLLCGATIIWAFTGYLAELIAIYAVVPFDGAAACSLNADWSMIVDLDEYVPIDASNCIQFAAGAMQFEGLNILATPEILKAAQYLAWTDVINASTWILVVLVLEVEVRLQLQGRLTDRVVAGTRYLKYFLYSILFIAAIYWGAAGDFIDFWDASLWLFAFLFIELNVFDWHQESKHSTPEAVT
ncbi:MAG: hypothetical protein AAGG55_04175 [Pseudomonadota bacterium]